jgi:hypothetical protein
MRARKQRAAAPAGGGVMDELRRRRVRDVEQTSARPMPREFHVGPWIVIAVIIGLLILFL